ncbi:transglutaminase family protein [Solitalea sp. MAHUQ-68]|uniref:Transglutaminase family protein n=1 Tax=Solitalea agri TaxID=2953739 RepID=A0A9X2F4Y9_9SPHI|nr:transglutaminase family protein [Solitalea agri]MCO4294396.1 transglutaminase family protein [Solitalea agri]
MPELYIQHLTVYNYQNSVRDSANQIMLYPINDDYQQVIKQDVKISGDPLVDVYFDYYGNEVGVFTYNEPHKELNIKSKLKVETYPRPLPVDDMFASLQWDKLEKLKNQIPYIDYLKQEQFDGLEELRQIVKPERKADYTPYQASLHFCKCIYENFEYIKGVTTVETTLDEIWQLKAGVCQDFAHILLVMLRLINIPARYVSGYICPNKNGMRGEGATHAWAEAYIPEYGWLGLDPTNNCIANETHVRLAVGRNFSDCSPVKGVYKGGGDHSLNVSVMVGNEDNLQSDFGDIIESVNQTVNNRNSYQRHIEIVHQQQQQQQQ